MSGVTYRIFGGLGSPYSMKMRAILRYRRLPHVWVQLNDRNAYEIANVKPAVIPVIRFPDGTLRNDSTPLIFELERLHPDDRSILPADEAQAFLACLIEDMADEWGTKMMFHYRWFRERDQKQMASWLAFDRLTGRGRETIATHAAQFGARQIGRMALVGCTAKNKPLIEETARRILALLEAHVTEEPYLFGSRPSLADFAWMGQLSQLATDPTPADLMRETAPFTFRWLAQLDDASGVEGEWRDPAAPLSAAVTGLLKMAGEVYFPFLIANEEALKRGAETFAFQAFGMDYEQGAFKYQAKCLAELRARFAALSGDGRRRLDPALREAGCLAVLAA